MVTLQSALSIIIDDWAICRGIYAAFFAVCARKHAAYCTYGTSVDLDAVEPAGCEVAD